MGNYLLLDFPKINHKKGLLNIVGYDFVTDFLVSLYELALHFLITVCSYVFFALSHIYLCYIYAGLMALTRKR